MLPFAPVVIFGYKRPAHLLKTLESLAKCDGFEQSSIIVYFDGPRNSKEIPSVELTRSVARKFLGDKAEYHISNNNKGLARSMIDGVSAVVNNYGSAIVIEDDLEFSPGFLRFMNEALNRYAQEEAVFHVSGYMFEIQDYNALKNPVFLPFINSWGWATWKRAWDQFDFEASGWEEVCVNKFLRNKFNLNGVYDFSSMLVGQMIGLRDSWAIRWYWTVFCKRGVALYPPTSLVRNNGFDGSGTHGRGVLRGFSKSQSLKFDVNFEFPKTVSVESCHYEIVKDALSRLNGGFIGRIFDRLRWSRILLSRWRLK